MMKQVCAYWVFGCILVGLAAGSYETHCPQDKYPKSYEVAAGVAIWPTYIVWAVVNSRKPACEVPPVTTAQ